MIKVSTAKQRRREGLIANKENAFTLVEVMVAVALSAMLAGGLIGVLILSQYSTQAARHRSIAVDLISSRLEDIATWPDTTMQGLVNGGGGSTSLVETTLSYPITDINFKNGFQNRTTTFTKTQNCYQVSVQVSWNERSVGSQRTMLESSSTYILPTQ